MDETWEDQLIKKSFEKIFSRKSDLMGIFGVVGYRGSQFVVQLGLALLLPTVQYAELFLFLTAVNAFAGIAGESLGMTLARQLRSLPEEKRTINVSDLFSLFMLGVLAGLGFLAYFVILKDSARPENGLLGLGFVLVVITTLNLVFQYLLIVFDLERWLLRSQLLYGFILVGFVSFVFSGSSSSLILQLIVGASAILLVTQILFLIFLSGRTKHSIQWASGSFLNRFSRFVLDSGTIAVPMLLGTPVHLFCLSILKLSDDINGTETASFAFAFLFYTLVSFIPGASGSFVVKYFAKAKAENADEDAARAGGSGAGPKADSGASARVQDGLTSGVRRLKNLISAYFAVMVVPVIGLLLLAPFIVSQLIPKFESSLKTVCVLILAGVIAGATMIVGHYFNSIYRSIKVTQYLAVYAVSYVTLCLFLVGYLKLGSLGLALSLLVAVMVQLIFMLKQIVFVKKA